jgi:thiamine-phosphate pyrophosphorylase
MSPSENGVEPTPDKTIGRLHVITDFHLQQRFSHDELARQVARGGADVVQFRQKHGGIRNTLIEARKTQAVCEEASIPLVVNDYVDVALAVEAAGVHLGQDDFPIREARNVLGPQVLIGASASTPEQAIEACEAGADYIGYGPIFATNSKSNAGATKDLDELEAACAEIPAPVIAIGGITHDRARLVLEAGAYGVAVLSAITTANNPERATARFRSAIDNALGEAT